MSKTKQDKAAYARAYRETHTDSAASKAKKAERGRRYWASHRELGSVRHQKYYQAHKEQYRIYNQRRQAQIRDRNIQRKYGLTKDQVGVLLQTQGGVCSICKRPGWNGTGPHIDHDHGTGMIRGILCGNCNRALGLIYDNPSIAQAMVDYLNRFGENPKE